ncbi:threonine--tRNA ligase [Micromonospora sp. C31]|uniref:threonine--tRNA ligase n=1 Tax=Micromonospora sp. C31 TaxID=2824876 RepID=UPI001B384A7D|nr:threonine--tRNA ligase [Micromonospora sp. C31]MBQ1074499.1 threonine--tRNA ligase [Micromonospora sp. C31]
MIDHRRLGRELELFGSDPLAGAGLPLWLPAGAAARHAVEEYVRELERRAGYRHVHTPPLGRRELFELSGHLGHFADDMFPPMALGADDEFVLRPSLCPHHALVFRARGRSYRELPLRIAELGGMYRAERSGVLGGLSRVRAISLNDAHNFCALEQVGEEVVEILRLIREAHAALGVRPAGFRLSLRGPGQRYVGDDAGWARAEALLRAALDGVQFTEAPGEAAFYGPKIDIQVRDAAGREFTLSTVQLDFDKPERFDLSYTDASGARRRPVMVHRSLVGSMERLFAYLIEVHEGAFPAWYAPVQLVVLPVGDGQAEAAARLARDASAAGLRVEIDGAGSLGSRIRDAARARVPYAAVLGPREVAEGAVSLRLRGGRALDPMPAADALELIGAVVADRGHALLPPR